MSPFFGFFPENKFSFIFDSAPLEYIASNKPCVTKTVGEIFNQFGYGIAFTKNSPFVEIFSLEILKMRENGSMEALKTRWISAGSCLAQEDGQWLLWYCYLYVSKFACLVLLSIHPSGHPLKQLSTNETTDSDSVPVDTLGRTQFHIITLTWSQRSYQLFKFNSLRFHLYA